MMKSVLTALVLGAGVLFATPQMASAAPLGMQGVQAPASTNVEKVHGRRHWHHHHWRGHHHHYHWRRHHYRPHAYYGGFSVGPWAYGGPRFYYHNHHRHHRHHHRWHW